VLRLFLFILVIYLVWKILEPQINKIFTPKSEIKGTGKSKEININPDNIEDAQFKEINDTNPDSKKSPDK
jgi:hypothetical protein